MRLKTTYGVPVPPPTKGLAALVRQPQRRMVDLESLSESSIVRLRGQVAAALAAALSTIEVTTAIAEAVKRQLTVVA